MINGLDCILPRLQCMLFGKKGKQKEVAKNSESISIFFFTSVVVPIFGVT